MVLNQDNVLLIGTSHVSKESKDKINSAFEKFKPAIICVELDQNRYYALMHPDKKGKPSLRQLGVTGYLFALIGGFFQKRLGKITGMTPGEEMLLGATLAKNNKLNLMLIDQDAAITLRNMSKKVRFREKFRIFLDLFRGPFLKDFKINIDINKIPEDEVIVKILGLMQKRYPGFYKVLIDDRNRHMIRKIYVLMKNNPEKRIMVIVGAGHVAGMKKHLKSLIESNIY
ncbi:MAG: TraB/GumN family protein [Candidatus Nanoarchaeia archaeon]